MRGHREPAEGKGPGKPAGLSGAHPSQEGVDRDCFARDGKILRLRARRVRPDVLRERKPECGKERDPSARADLARDRVCGQRRYRNCNAAHRIHGKGDRTDCDDVRPDISHQRVERKSGRMRDA